MERGHNPQILGALVSGPASPPSAVGDVGGPFFGDLVSVFGDSWLVSEGASVVEDRPGSPAIRFPSVLTRPGTGVAQLLSSPVFSQLLYLLCCGHATFHLGHLHRLSYALRFRNRWG